MKVRFDFPASDNASNLNLDPRPHIDPDVLAHIGLEQTISGARIYNGLNSWRLAGMAITESDWKQRYPSTGFPWVCRVRRIQWEDLVVEAHPRYGLENPRRPVLWNAEN